MARVLHPIRLTLNSGLFQIPRFLLQEKAALPSQNHRENPGLAQPQAEGLGLFVFQSLVPGTVAGGDSGPGDHFGRGGDYRVQR